MKQIEEAYVSFDVAKLLKEKGFDVPCGSYYEYYRSNVTMYKGYVPEYSDSNKNHNKNKGNVNIFSRPTQQTATAWLYEEHLLWLTIYPKQLEEGVVWVCDIYDEDCDVIKSLTSSTNEEPTPFIDNCIKYCLENLVKE